MKKVYFSEENIPSLKKYVDEGKDIPPYEADKFYIGDEGGSPTYYHVSTKKDDVVEETWNGGETSIDTDNLYSLYVEPEDEKPEYWDDEEDGNWEEEKEWNARYWLIGYDASENELFRTWVNYYDLDKYFEDYLVNMIINHEGSDGKHKDGDSFWINEIPYLVEIDNSNPNEVWEFLKKISDDRGPSGFILPDGDCVYSYDHLGMASQVDLTLTQLLAMGAIRFTCAFGIDLSVEPTTSQVYTLKGILRGANQTIYVDICDSNDNGRNYPDTICSGSYEPDEYQRAVNDIINYFCNGIKLKMITENAIDEVEPSQINLSSFKKEKTINKKLWNGMELNPKVRLRLLEIGDKFWDDLEIKWVSPKDYYMMGSMCNYNWSKYSDIDLHIIVDFSKVDKRVDFVKKFFDSKKNEWNNNHSDLNMFGYPIEIYVQDVNEDNASGGIFSLYKNKWIKTPEESDIKPIGIEKYEIKDISADIMTIIDGMQETIDNSDDLHDIDVLCDDVSKLKEMLRNNRQEGLSKDGEMAVWNIVYKVLRRSGYLDKLRDIGTRAYDKVNSITESLLSYVYKTVLNEEVVADGNAQHNPYQKRWKQERKELKEYIIAYGTLMTSMENGKQYVVLFQPEISRLVGNNYGLCIQYNQEENKYLSTIYIRAMDKFTEQIFKPEFDTRGMDNIAGTGDDNLSGQITY